MPTVPPRVPYAITVDTIAHGVERAQSRGRSIPAAFLPTDMANSYQTTGPALPKAPQPAQPSMPSNHVTHIVHRHQYPPCFSSLATRIPEYSQSAVVGYDDDSSNKDDHSGCCTPPSQGVQHSPTPAHKLTQV